ncbi:MULTISPECIES: KUP/HAK/KT family potassium transporter [Flavobacterium]|uniref:KUP/HAK/KT family potassium transporter n=1 Tax=Flavobacterium TaxID=237 RepID=UPI002224BD3A|nr:KUP/HAK/KT family potassium transporter [Flavobacterium sp. N1846]
MITPSFKVVQIINIIALLFLVLGAYGIAATGIFQVIAALCFLILFPSNKLIYIYFALVILFFLFWDGTFNLLFSIPIFLIFFLTFIIYKQKWKLKEENKTPITEFKN